jgi:hypothetical protein
MRLLAITTILLMSSFSQAQELSQNILHRRLLRMLQPTVYYLAQNSVTLTKNLLNS